MTKEKVAKLCVTQVKSQARCVETQVQCLKGLGLGKIGRKVIVNDDNCIRGLIRKVAHLVKVEGANE